SSERLYCPEHGNEGRALCLPILRRARFTVLRMKLRSSKAHCSSVTRAVATSSTAPGISESLAGGSGAGQFGGGDEAAHVALPVFRDVNGDAGGGGLVALAADFANAGQVLFVEAQHQSFVAIQCKVDGSQQIAGLFSVTGGPAFLLHGSDLFRRKLLTLEVGAEALGTACEVAGVEAGGSHTERGGPQQFGREIADGRFHIFADLFGGAQQVSGDGVDVLGDAAQPGFRLRRRGWWGEGLCG